MGKCFIAGKDSGGVNIYNAFQNRSWLRPWL